MDGERINNLISRGKAIYEVKRKLEDDVTTNEQMLFEACFCLEQLQAENEKLKNKITRIKTLQQNYAKSGSVIKNLAARQIKQALK